MKFMTKLFLFLLIIQIVTDIHASTTMSDIESNAIGIVEQRSSDSMAYLGQKVPDTVPEVFAPGIISKSEEYEFGSVLSINTDEFFYGVVRGSRSEILYTKLHGGVWSDAEIVLSHDIYSFNDPMLSPDENQLFFISDMPLRGKGKKKDSDIWYIERTKDGWGEPINIGSPINSERNEYYISFAENGTMYFASNSQAELSETYNFDIYKSELISNKFRTPVKLPKPINTSKYEADAFIAFDESYIIFSALRKDGYGRGDLYISFRTSNGGWSKAKNMGEAINNKHHQLCPFVDRDNKFLFFTSNRNIYWVNAEIIDLYREH